MTTLTFDFDDTYTVESRDVELDVPISDIAPEMAKRIFAYGLSAFTDAGNPAPRQAAIDALGEKKEKESAKDYDARIAKWVKDPANKQAIADKTLELMQKRLANVIKGIWTVRGAGMSRREKILDSIVRAAAKVALSEADWKTFDDMSDEEQSAKVKAWYEGNKAAFDLATDEKIALLDAAKLARKNTQEAVKIAL